MKLLIFLSNLTFQICFQIKFRFTLLGASKTITLVSLKKPKVTPFGFLKNVGAPTTLECESDPTFPETINDWKCTNFSTGDVCGSCGNVCFRFIIVTPGLTDTCSGFSNIDLDSCTKYCLEYALVDAWLCCALYDLAVDLNVIRYTFHDAWLTGTAYLPQYKYKSKTKGNGTVKDKFCGPGGDKLGSDNYKAQKCCDRGGGAGFKDGNDCNKCIVRGPDPVDKDKGNDYQQNNYETGASDVGDMIYCPENYPTKIVNLGRTDACQDVIDRIDRCIVSQECMLDIYKSSPCTTGTNGINNCLTGTYYESGYDTEQWVNDMGLTSYQDPAMVMLWLMVDCKKGVEQLFGDDNDCGIATNDCGECECNNDVWDWIREVSKIYTDIIIGPDLPPDAIQQFGGFDFDPQQRPRFHPSWHGSSRDNDVKLGDTSKRHHLANVPYFYFGLINGGTAIDKLRELYLVEKKAN